MPLDAIWSEIHEQQLEWDPSELAIYLDPSFGSDQRLLQRPMRKRQRCYIPGVMSTEIVHVDVALPSIWPD